MEKISSISKQAASDRNAPQSFFKPAILPKLTVNDPNDVHEQEADAMADHIMRMTDSTIAQPKFFNPTVSPVQRKCEHCEEEEKKELQRKETNGGPVRADSSLDSYVGNLDSSGQSLSSEARNFYEPRFGYDFGQVKVHTDSVAAKSAQSINALAYTSGNNIVFNSGQYSPGSDGGKKLLAHELAHVVQQNNTSSIFRQLSPAMCAADCTVPDNSTGEKGKFTLEVYADKEGPFLLIPATHDVGHSWLKLTDKSGNTWTYGFWPQKGFEAAHLTKDVEGCVHHPDTAHRPSASQTYDLTEAEFDAAKAEAVAICNTKPMYNLFGLQCTTFVGRVMGAAAKRPFGGFGLIWDSPNAFATWLKTGGWQVGFKATQTTSLGSGDSAVSLGAEVTYTKQFYAALGNKIRLEWMSSAELGSKVQSVSTGVGVELNPQTILLPSVYVFGGATAGRLGGPTGDGGAGFKAAVGLNYNIDEIAYVKVEYSLVKDLVAKDSQLQQLSASVGFRF